MASKDQGASTTGETAAPAAPAAPRAKGPRAPMGGLVAVVGPDASGKTTVARRLVSWYGEQGEALIATSAYPPPTPATRVARLGIRAGRKLVRRWWEGTGAGDAVPPLRACQHVVDAYERVRYARRQAALARRGVVIVGDRFPCQVVGAPTGPRIVGQGWIAGALGRAERWLYARAPQPDVVVRLHVDVEEAVRRNAARPAPKPEEMIRTSQEDVARIRYDAPRLDVDATRPLDDLLVDVQTFTRGVLAARRGAERELVRAD